MSDDYEVFSEGRGSLLPIELASLDFEVRRVFVVTGPEEGAERGDHVVPCTEEVVLLAGRAEFVVTANGLPDRRLVLERPGQRIRLTRGQRMRYRLHSDRSQILVLADEPYAPHERPRP